MFVRKPTRPSLPLRKAPPLISVFFNSLYDPFGSPCRGQKRRSKPLRFKVGGASDPSPDGCAGWDRLGIRDISNGDIKNKYSYGSI